MENSLGKKIKSIRKEKSLTQRQLSELAGISEISVRKYEKDILNPKYSTLEKIASALNISIFEFLDLEDQIKFQFEEHFNMPDEINSDLEIQTMLKTLDVKLAISSMLTNFACFKHLTSIYTDEKDLDLLSEIIGNNMISTIDNFSKVNLSLQKKNHNLEKENEELKLKIKVLNNKTLAPDIKENLMLDDESQKILLENVELMDENQNLEKQIKKLEKEIYDLMNKK